MRKSRVQRGCLFALLVVIAVSLQACSGAWLRINHVPEDGYERTLNYQFQAQVHSDSLGNCRMMMVRVKALNKMYSKQEPPPRLQLFDDDCMSPLRFERVHYVSKQTGEHIRLSGTDVVHFFSDNARLESELIEWLWYEGVI